MRFPTTVVCLLILKIVCTESRSIKDSEHNVTKPTTKDDLFPDWVPFKNKHGDELGEFVQVVTKRPKKRLAMPMNFMIKAVAEPVPEDYERLGDSDGEDYYEKREWSDSNRGPNKADDSGAPIINHADISDIDGVLGIITKHKSPSPNPSPNRTTTEKPSNEPSHKRVKVKPKKNEDYSEEEETAENPKIDLEKGEEIPSESEAKKAAILDSVDELKERHALEQKSISEKVKEEAMHAEERDRDIMQSEIFDKYNQRSRGRKLDYDDYDLTVNDKYKISPFKKTTIATTTTTTELPESSSRSVTTTHRTAQTGRLSVFRNPSIYMIYDDETSTESTTQPTSSTDSSETHTIRYSSRITESPPRKRSKNHKRRERISLVPQDNELREGEPTLFFPKKIKRTNKTKSKTEKTKDSSVAEFANDNTPQETVGNLTKVLSNETLPSGTDAVDLTGAGSVIEPSASGLAKTGSSELEPIHSGSAEYEVTGSAPSGDAASGVGETGASAPAQTSGPSVDPLAVDVAAASSDHKEEKKKDEDHEFEKGGESEHHAEHHSEHGESGKKAYEVEALTWRKMKQVEMSPNLVDKPKPWYYSYCCGVDGYHEDKKTAKGHHDKEDHLGKYDDHGSVEKEHHDEKSHYGAHHHEEHGKKHAKYEESGKHSKGHSTKGSHDIHKKEEYEKKVEFFEEEGDSAEEEKHGGHTEEKEHSHGGGFKKGNHDAGYHDRAKGDSGHFHKSGHHNSHKGHKESGGHDAHGKHGGDKFSASGQTSGKKWIYHHGSPAKNANLVVIDRRGDQLYHGPQYYG